MKATSKTTTTKDNQLSFDQIEIEGWYQPINSPYMKTISHQEFLDFIFSQPREREIDMGQNIAYPEDCGCMMVHYGREKGLKGNILCGFRDISESGKTGAFLLEENITNYFPINDWRKYTYGEIQDYIRGK